jgi:hypothetical protein
MRLWSVLLLASLMTAAAVADPAAPDVSRLLALGPDGLPAAFEHVTFGMPKADVPKAWKAYDPGLGGARYGELFAVPLFDDPGHTVVRLMMSGLSWRDDSRLAKQLVDAFGTAKISGDDRLVWYWPDRHVRAEVTVNLVFERYRPLADLKLAPLLDVTGKDLAQAQRAAGVAPEVTDDYASFALAPSEYGTVVLRVHLSAKRISDAWVEVAVPVGTANTVADAVKKLDSHLAIEADRDVVRIRRAK